MSPLIDIAPGAERLPLAVSIAELVRSNVAVDAKRRAAFDRLRGAVAVIAYDRETALTLRFDFGRLVIHSGVVGVPDVTLRGPAAVLESLGDVPRPSLPGLALGIARDGGARAALGTLLDRSGRTPLKLYGLVAHPVLVQRLLTVLSKQS